MRRFNFICKRCGSLLEATQARCGQSGRCPTCDAQFLIPEIHPRTGRALGPADPGDDGQDPTPMHAYGAAGDRAPQIERGHDDRLTIRCRRCGAGSAIESDLCVACGLPFTMDGQDVLVTETPGTCATLALVCGLASMICIPIPVFGPAAIVFGVVALWESAAKGRAGQGRAVAGILAGGAGILLTLSLTELFE